MKHINQLEVVAIDVWSKLQKIDVLLYHIWENVQGETFAVLLNCKCFLQITVLLITYIAKSTETQSNVCIHKLVHT